MDKLKFTLLLIIVLYLMVISGYWAVKTLQSGPDYQTDQDFKNLRAENEELKIKIAKLTEEVNTLEAQISENSQTQNTEPVTTKPVAYKHQDLINDLQKLVDDNILMKSGSTGTSVGTVQKFLNVYNDTSDRIDNDYGPATEKAVTAFQKEQGITADGQAGSGTFTKMISWLKKQS